MLGDAVPCNSGVVAKFQLAESQWAGFNFLSYLNMGTLNTEVYETNGQSGKRCLLDQRKGKLETFILQIT